MRVSEYRAILDPKPTMIHQIDMLGCWHIQRIPEIKYTTYIFCAAYSAHRVRLRALAHLDRRQSPPRASSSGSLSRPCLTYGVHLSAKISLHSITVMQHRVLHPSRPARHRLFLWRSVLVTKEAPYHTVNATRDTGARGMASQVASKYLCRINTSRDICDCSKNV